MERDNLTMIVAQNIEALMAQKGLTAAEVQRRAGINQTGLYDILSGKSKSPRLDTISKIAVRGLGVPVWALLREISNDQVGEQLNCVVDLLPPADRKRLLRMAEVMIEDAAEQDHEKGPEA